MSLCAGASTTHAQKAPSYRLGLMQLENDAMRNISVAPKLMNELRQALSQRREYTVVDTHVTLTQLSLAEDCNVTELSCLSRIAEKMKLDGFVFGKLTHDAGEVPMASFRRYDKARSAIQSTALVSFGTGKLSDQRIRADADQLATKLLGPSGPAVVAITPVPPSAPSASAAAAPRSPTATPSPTPTPAQSPTPEAAAAAAASTGQHESLVEPAQLRTTGSLSVRKFAGYALLGGAAASVGLSVLSFVEVDRAGSNSSFLEYRTLVGKANDKVKDVCDEANANKTYGLTPERLREVKSSCGTGSTFEILQYVFIGSALVTGGLATFFLFGGDDSRSAAKNQPGKLTLHPAVRGGGATLTARFYF
jgi:hypothetical protein